MRASGKRFLSSKLLASRLGLLLAVLVPLGITFAAWKAVSNSLYQKNYAEFLALTQESEKALLHRMDSYHQVLLGGTGFFNGSTNVSSKEWQSYVQALDVGKNYPGIRGIGYVSNVAPRDVPGFLKERRKDGMPDFAIHPLTEKNRFFIVTYIEPLKTNEPALGLNVAFEKHRLEAALLSRDSGQAAMTKRVLLVQDTTKQPGFHLLYPVYRKGMAASTPEERETALKGWIFAPFVGRDFLQELTKSQGTLLELAVYDGNEEHLTNLIFNSRKETPGEAPLFTVRKELTLMHQRWFIVWTSTKAFEKAARTAEPAVILIGGLVFTLLFGLFLLVITQRAETVQRLVEEQTQKLKQLNHLNSAILDSTAYLVVATDTDGRILLFNKQAERSLGYSAQEAVHQLTPGIWHDWEEIAERAMQLSQEYDRNIAPGFDVFTYKPLREGSESREWTVIRKDGSRFPVNLTVTPLHDDTMEVTGFLCVLEDISKRKAQQEALETSEETFRFAMEHASIGMALIDPGGRFLKVNQALVNLTGYSKLELMTMYSEDITHPDDRAEGREYKRRIMAGKIATYQLEKRYIRKDGELITVMVNVSLAWNADDTPKYFIVQIQDITERKEMERLKNEFISIVSHELRTPLTSIRGSLGLIVGTMAGGLPEKAHHLINIALKNSERLILLINDILDIDKIASGQMRFDMRQENLVVLVQQAIESNRAYGEKFKVGFRLKAPATEIMVTVDASRLVQVLTNLLSNAAKFSPEGKQVDVLVTCKSGQARVSIKDKGPGIPEEFQNLIFNKFCQADSSSTRQKGGSGLGLHISRQIMQQMNGQIGFDTVIGKGTTFWIELPAVLDSASLRNRTVSPRSSKPCVGGTSLPRILHVEDDADLSNVLATALYAKAELITATTLREAEQRLQKEDFELIVLDVMMPDGSGLMLLEHLPDLTENPPPVLILAANEVGEGIASQVAGVMIKSRLSESKVVETILKLVRRHNRKKEEIHEA